MSSLRAMPGGKELNIRPKPILVGHWQALLTEAAKPAIGKYEIENCHDNYGTVVRDVHGEDTGAWYPEDLATCPYTMFRTSSDIRPVWGRIMHNLQTVVPFLAPPNSDATVTPSPSPSSSPSPSLSRPGCHAFPDMLEARPMRDIFLLCLSLPRTHSI